MFALICFVFAILVSPFRSKISLEAENMALRHQRRQVRGRVRLTDDDRLFLIQLYRWFPLIPLGEGKRAVLLAIGQVNLLKLVIVVEDDVDPEDWRQVEWSLAARFLGHEDLIVLSAVKADRCDPVHEDLTVTKIGMIATTRPGDGTPGSRSELAKPPIAVLERIKSELDRY